MPRSDQSQTAILGALSILPMTGYALRQEIRDTLGQFWSESFGQIYPVLAELERNRLVERQEATDSRSSKFSITDAGIARLRELLAEPPQAQNPRNGLMLRLFFGRQLGPEACGQLVLQAREQAVAALARMEAARAEVAENGGLAHAAPYILLTVSAGEHSARATIAWADEALANLAKLGATSSQPARGRSRP
ncbi:MAG: PadR family transcriptional regulator [Candidatus Saccharibacteria bacterium]|nr:PadR family transcriptional regulator [Microbacteriaceae bacterium]